MNLKQMADEMISGVSEYVARALQPFEARVAALEARPAPTKGDKGDQGTSVDLEAVRETWYAMHAREFSGWHGAFVSAAQLALAELVAGLPKPQDGKSVSIEEVRELVERAVAEIPRPKDGTSITIDEIRPIVDQFLRSIPSPKDGTSVTIDDVRPIVERYLEALPRPRDGQDGKSVTLEEVRSYLDDQHSAWALGFERRATDMLLRAIERMPAPKDGRDGFSLDDLQLEQTDERTFVLRFVRGDLVREQTIRLGHPLDRGVFREGTAYERGDGVTFGGSWWIAQKDAPEGKPGASADWRLAVKKGRDGSGT